MVATWELSLALIRAGGIDAALLKLRLYHANALTLNITRPAQDAGPTFGGKAKNGQAEPGVPNGRLADGWGGAVRALAALDLGAMLGREAYATNGGAVPAIQGF